MSSGYAFLWALRLSDRAHLQRRARADLKATPCAAELLWSMYPCTAFLALDAQSAGAAGLPRTPCAGPALLMPGFCLAADIFAEKAYHTVSHVPCVLQALAVWKMARRDRALSNKITKLAGQPCSYDPNTIEFSVNNNNGREDTTARERTLGLNNRVLAGLFLHTWRTMDQRCPPSRLVQQLQPRAANFQLTGLRAACRLE